MASYLYCILRPAKAEALPPALRGVGGVEVRSLSSAALQPLEAWVSTISGDQIRTTGEDRASQALVHNDVVNAALSTGRTPVPTRFGVSFLDDEACMRALVELRPRLLSALDRIAHAVEISVLVVPRHATAVRPARQDGRRPGAGRRYLEDIREQAETAARRLQIVSAEADRISEAVGNIVRAERRSVEGRRAVASLAHLVSRDAVEAYRRSIDSLRTSDAVRIILSEVRAPYSFAELGAPGTGHDSGSPNHNE